jgi:hypothetical protein
MYQTTTIHPDGSKTPGGWYHGFEDGETWEVEAFTKPEDRDFRISLLNPKTGQEIEIDVIPIASALELYRKLKAALREMKGS